MTELSMKPNHIWLRSFYGFSPEDDGYIGWTDEGARERMLGLIEEGDLFLIYGASSSETQVTQRNRVIGFLQVRKARIRDADKASAAGMQRKRDKGWQDRWTYAVPVVRAWRADEQILLERVAPTTYRPEAGQAIAVWNPPLLAEEVELALKIRVREVNVFGEPPVTTLSPVSEPLLLSFSPSRGVPGSFGQRTSVYEDGPTLLYLAQFVGDGFALLAEKKPLFDDRVLMKIGVSGDIRRREKEINAGFPPAAVGRWRMKLVSQSFPDRAGAEAAEQTFKDRAAPALESLGKEFFRGRWEIAESIFAGVPGVSRFGRS